LKQCKSAASLLKSTGASEKRQGGLQKHRKISKVEHKSSAKVAHWDAEA